MQGEAKEEVRARLNIEDVIGEYVVLKRAGRNFKGLSPFSQEKTPSFVVSPDKQIWHDFSSNRGGDVFGFVMEVEGMDFRQALEHLARKAGVDLSLYQSGGDRQLAAEKQQLLRLHDLATRYFQATLVRNKHAIDYVFGQRRLSKQVVTDFRIGYAPDNGQALVGFLTKKGFSSDQLKRAGVVNRYGSDLFRGRMTVSLMAADGQVIGFTGRILNDEPNAPKYLNTPQTILYDKSRHVFGLSQAKEAIRSENFVVLVEGNLDVVSSHQAGVRQVVATAGTAMTEYHLKALKRLTADIRLCFDGDKAGILATERAIGIASQLGIELSIVSLPASAKDPDELILQSVEAWQTAIRQTTPAVDWIIDQYAQREDLTTASGKRRFTSAALVLIAQLSDTVERDHYEAKVATMTGSSRAAIQQKSQQLETETDEGLKRSVKTNPGVLDGKYNYQDDLLALLAIDVPSRDLLSQFDLTLLAGEERQALARYIAAHTDKVLADAPKELQDIATYVKIVLLKADTRYESWSADDRYFETARLIRQVEYEHKTQKKYELTERLRQAEAQSNDAEASELRSELNTLIKELARAKR